MMLNFPDRLKKLRTDRKLTQEGLAEAINCSRVTITYYEQGKRIPSLDILNLLANYFNVSIDYLLGRTDSPVCFKYLNESLRVMLLFCPETGRIYDCSQAAVSFYGYSKNDLLNMTIFDLNTDSHEETRQNINKATKNEQNIFYCRHRMSNGLIKDVEINSEPIEVNGKPLLYSIYRDTSKFKVKENEMSSIITSLIKIIGSTLEVKNPYKKDHATKVQKISNLIGKKIGLSNEQLYSLNTACILHDIGELYIPMEILNKIGKLNKEELEIIKKHPEKGYSIIKNVEFPLPVADIILQHHERLDGSGYPNGLRENKILIEAKILAVADVFEAMTSKRPYHDPFSQEKALQTLLKYKAKKFDSLIVDICTDIIIENPNF